MPYGEVRTNLSEGRLRILVDLPEAGEPSLRGNAENLVQPNVWIPVEDVCDGADRLHVEVVVCRLKGRFRRRN